MLFIVSPAATQLFEQVPIPEVARIAVSRLLLGAADGQHIVIMEPKLCRILENSDDFSAIDRSTARQIRNRYADLGSLPSKLARYAEVVEDGDVPTLVGSTWVVPLAWIAQNPLPESRCVAEDLHDTELFRAAAQDHADTIGLHAFRIRVHEVPGGGANTHRVIENEALTARHICICVLDSDRRHPDSPLGQTAQASLEVKGDGLYEILTTSGRTIENSIPWRLIDLVRVQRVPPSQELASFERLHPSSTKLLDLKRGICGFNIRQADGQEGARFWSQAAEAFAGKPQCCDAPCDAPTIGECKYHVHRGFGTQLLSDVVTWLRDNAGRKRFQQYLPSPNDQDWKEIGAMVTAYGLGKDRRRT